MPHLALVCGRYEGIDERVRATIVDREVSIGDYVLTGGELPALVLTDAIVRLLPGRHPGGVARPATRSPPACSSTRSTRGPRCSAISRCRPSCGPGNHGEVDRWRRREALRRTRDRRPDLLADAPLTDEDRATLDELGTTPEAALSAPPRGCYTPAVAAAIGRSRSCVTCR